MAHHTLIDGTASGVKSGCTLGNLPAGTSVYRNEAGVLVEHVIAYQGALYDGTLLLRKDTCENRQRHAVGANDYANSAINAYLNGTFFDSLISDIRGTIKQGRCVYGT